MKDVLIIVDVQLHFPSVTDQYVDGIFELCETFDEVYQIWDAIDSDKPDFEFPNEIEKIRKEYGGELLEEDIDSYNFSKKDKDLLKERFAEESFEPGDMFANEYNLSRNWFLYVGGNHTWFIVEEKLFQLFEKLRDEGKRAILCGGALMECLEDIRVLADSVGLESMVLQTHTY